MRLPSNNAVEFKEAPLQELFLPEFQLRGLRLSILRGDLIHPVISGNKLWKLKYNLIEALHLKKSRLITFGGAYSNHLLATAAATREFGFKSTGIVRGDERMDNPVLTQCRSYGMELVQVSRAAYRDKEQLIRNLNFDITENYILPEGGSNALAVRGCAEAVPAAQIFDHIFVPVGTGATAAGIALGASSLFEHARVEGIAVLKGGSFLQNEIERLAPGLKNWNLHLDYHHGGYAKTSSKLLEFIHAFKSSTGIVLDPIYTGKTMAGIFELVSRNYFRTTARILMIHTGGTAIEALNPRLD